MRRECRGLLPQVPWLCVYPFMLLDVVKHGKAQQFACDLRGGSLGCLGLHSMWLMQLIGRLTAH